MDFQAGLRRRLWAATISAGTLVTLAACAPPIGQGAAAQVPLAYFAPVNPPTAPLPSKPTPPSPIVMRVPPTDAPMEAPIVDTGQPEVIGTSVAGRNLEVFRFGSGERELLIVAGIHGGYEWNTIALADELIMWLKNSPERIPPEVSLYILRSLNPDGEARSHGYEARANENGVDLNRNWPVSWHSDWDRSYCWQYLPITAGPHPVSEPETAAAMKFILAHDFDGLISYHSAALGIFPGGTPPDTASQLLAESVAAVSAYRYPGLDYGCEYTGMFADWAASQGIPAVDVELSTHESLDFDINLRVLEMFLRWRP